MVKLCRDFLENYFDHGGKCLLGHGQLRILACTYNSLHKTAFMNICVMGACITCIISTYSLVIGFQQQSFGITSTVLFLILSTDSIAVIVSLFGEAGSVAHNSNEVYKSITKHHAIHGRSLSAHKRRFITKHLNSWGEIRVEFFSSNYFDRLTPLNLILFCVQNTVSLILLGR